MSGALCWECSCGNVACHFPAKQATNLRCYCRYCRHFAMDMGTADTLDSAGGANILHVLPDQITFDRGHEHLAVTHYSKKGVCRFYTDCCNTPVGSVPRSPKFPYASLTAFWVNPKSSIGPLKFFASKKSAQGPVTDDPGIPFLTFCRWTIRAIRSRLSGSYKNSPFYDEQGVLRAPIVDRPGPTKGA